MRIQVVLRGSLAGDGRPQTRVTVSLPPGATVEQLISHLAIPSSDVQMALVNGSPAVRTKTLASGDSVILAPPAWATLP